MRKTSISTLKIWFCVIRNTAYFFTRGTKSVFVLCKYTYSIMALCPTHNITVSKLYYLLCGVPPIAFVIIPKSLIKSRIIYFMYKFAIAAASRSSRFQVTRNNVVGIKRNGSLRPKQKYFQKSREATVIFFKTFFNISIIFKIVLNKKEMLHRPDAYLPLRLDVLINETTIII